MKRPKRLSVKVRLTVKVRISAKGVKCLIKKVNIAYFAMPILIVPTFYIFLYMSDVHINVEEIGVSTSIDIIL